MNNSYQKIIQWGCQYLSSHGYTLKCNLPEKVIDTPWSCVVRFASSDGYIYLKHTPALLALEAPIIRILQTQFHAAVPTIIAHNTKLHCFLMKDAGQPLREILKKQFDVDLYCKAIDQFTSLQLATADHVNAFLSVGVPDWRLDKLPNLFKELLSQEVILIENRLSKMEITELRTLVPNVFSLCQKLLRYSIKQTIVQPDFSDNNILIDILSQRLTTIDLGEIVISHPFFSLINCLQTIKKHHGLTMEDKSCLQIRDAYLKNYSHVESEQNLLAAFEIAQKLSFIYEALANYRLMLACDKGEWLAWKMHGRLMHSLKEFMAVCQRDYE